MSVKKNMPPTITKLRTGHTVDSVEDEIWKRVSTLNPPHDGMVRLTPGNWLFNNYMPAILDRIYDLKFTKDDVIVMTYPKSGTVWTSELVWTLLKNPNLDNPAASIASDFRIPFLETDQMVMLKLVPDVPKDAYIYEMLHQVGVEKYEGDTPLMTYLEHYKGQKILKTHIPLDVLPTSLIENSKVVYVARDPRNVIISKYHFFRVLILHRFAGNIDEWVDSFINEEQWYHPFFEHHMAAWKYRNHPNMFFMFYEDLLANPLHWIRKMSDFLGLERTDEQIKNVERLNSFENTKKRIASGELPEPISLGGRYRDTERSKEMPSHLRKGKSGGWEKDFSEENIKKINEWMAKNVAKFDDDYKYKIFN